MNDQEIIQQIRAGHIEAYRDFIREYQKKVLGYCLSMFSNRTDAEEAARDIFAKVYRSLDRFKGNSTFSTWLYRITVNHCIDILRKKNRRKAISLDALIEEDGSRIEGLFASDRVEGSAQETRDLADKILSTLPLEYRTVLSLREVNELEYQEIAAILDCSLDAVKSRLAWARKHLQDKLQHFLEPGSVYTEEGGKNKS
jgi:RNA polymerase sigma-70 factor, ECF subfamily